MRWNDVAEPIIGTALDDQRELGPGLLESAYEACLQFPLVGPRLGVERQKGLPIVDRDVRIECGNRIDPLVEHRNLVALRAVAQPEAIYEAQLLFCLTLSGGPVDPLQREAAQ